MDASAADAQERRRAAIDLARTTIDTAHRVRLRPGCTVLATSLQQAVAGRRDEGPADASAVLGAIRAS